MLAPEIKVKELFYGEWYDGPVWGVCEYEGEKYVYYLTNCTDDRLRIYAVIRVEKEVIDKLVHEKWRRGDGDITDLDPFEELDGDAMSSLELIGRFTW